MLARENARSLSYVFVTCMQGIGIGAVVFAPILGGLSDNYGRKPILLLFFVTAIFPQGEAVAAIWHQVVLCS